MTYHYWPAHRLADAIARGELSAVEALGLSIRRVEKFDSALNAVCCRVDERAFERACQADKARKKGESWGPLHGVPMTVKEGYDLVGTPTTWGRPDYAQNLPVTDAHAVRQFEAAGAVIFGKTNVPTDLRDWQSENPLYGRTVNPWDHSRTPGGSSGGSAVALAAGYAFMEAGSDIGGSLRNPAHFCGVCAHKPTYGVVPTTGHTLTDELVPSDISVCGPMARTARDLAIGFETMLGIDGPQALGWRVALPAPRHETLSDFRLAVVDDSSLCPVAGVVKAALRTVAEACAAAGAHVDMEVKLPVDEMAAHRTYIQLLRATIVGSMDDASYAQELASRAALETEDQSYRAQVTRALTQSYRDWVRAGQHRVIMQRAWAKFFETYDALLMPPAPTTAWPHDSADRFDRVIAVDKQTIGYYDELFWAGLTGVVYLPSTVVPAGLGDGLPVGVQIVGPYLEDWTALRLGEEIEKACGGFVPPPGLD